MQPENKGMPNNYGKGKKNGCKRRDREDLTMTSEDKKEDLVK
tara:strand:+ start:33 stop:158 length:126 start_codon:yes stop_codon:yes gene_type:complete